MNLADLPVADPWFTIERVGHGVTLLTEPHVHPLLRCNVWHVAGRTSDLVVDTALGLAPLRHLVERELPGELMAVATHFHTDHIGGLHEFSDRAIHLSEADRLTEPNLGCIDAAMYPESVLRPYRAAGYDIPELLVTAQPTDGLTGTVWEVAPAPVSRMLTEGDVIDLGDRAFEVLHLPGHSPGSIGLWEEATGVLFSGDAIYDGPLLDELEGSDTEAYARTIERLTTMPVEVVHGGHEASFDRARLIQLCTTYLDSQ